MLPVLPPPAARPQLALACVGLQPGFGKNQLAAQATATRCCLAQVWALVDLDGDGRVDYHTLILSGYANPNGVAWRDGDLFIGLPTRIVRLDNIDRYALHKKPYTRTPTTVLELPVQDFHQSRYLSFGPNGKLYFGIGGWVVVGRWWVVGQTPCLLHCCGQHLAALTAPAPACLARLALTAGMPCDVCVPPTYRRNATSPKFLHGSIHRANADGTGVELWASGAAGWPAGGWPAACGATSAPAHAPRAPPRGTVGPPSQPATRSCPAAHPVLCRPQEQRGL